jgi:hypothetical protein
MRNLSAAALALTAALAAQPAAAASNRAAPATGLHFVDLTDDFDRVWGETKNLPDDKRVEAFQTGFAKILPGFYAADRVKDWMTPEKYHAFVLKGLKAYPEQRAGIRKVSGQFGSLVAPARKQFESVFGRMTGYPPIYLVVSFGEFDGGTRDLPEGNRLMFGADMIDRLYKTTPIKPFVEHELFHLMHHRNFPECDPVWCNLWEEGLATYVASKLNPGASDTALGLTFPAPSRPAVEAHRQEAICAVRSRLDSKEPADYGPLFMGGGQPLSANLPRRFGYYVGLLVVQEAGRTRSLKELAALKPNEVRPLVGTILDKMASCPSKGA